MAECVLKNGFSCVVGLPQHLLALSYGLPHGAVRTMLPPIRPPAAAPPTAPGATETVPVVTGPAGATRTAPSC